MKGRLRLYCNWYDPFRISHRNGFRDGSSSPIKIKNAKPKTKNKAKTIDYQPRLMMSSLCPCNMLNCTAGSILAKWLLLIILFVEYSLTHIVSTSLPCPIEHSQREDFDGNPLGIPFVSEDISIL